ncbi:MAG: hypothetical protein GFH27_549283n193 [Chloroflexi bacterium AL-W]|nr:hypothetical protein [Chloroflexi bacterium AL-N1]NOK64686.1 hypothetical protein [Chloroflexi bacterium AL-N10]NOK75927.1 hypothetical protein [Chloroflexi bacterium AL-N5]NOK80314.1 hypothetical protein [Chloroflexi bacterium AL-W]NOK86827.1 hypothetical protein [Chloroflexi bacterium AL-N15]
MFYTLCFSITEITQKTTRVWSEYGHLFCKGANIVRLRNAMGKDQITSPVSTWLRKMPNVPFEVADEQGLVFGD